MLRTLRFVSCRSSAQAALGAAAPSDEDASETTPKGGKKEPSARNSRCFFWHLGVRLSHAASVQVGGTHTNIPSSRTRPISVF